MTFTHLFYFYLFVNFINASLTYPIKGTYIGWEAGNWDNIGINIRAAADSGCNMIVMSFYSAQPQEMVDAWVKISAAQKQSHIQYVHDKGAVFLLGVRIANNQFSNLSLYDPNQLGLMAANWAKEYRFDGIDFLIQPDGDDFQLGPRNGLDSVNWIVSLVNSTRTNLDELIGNKSIITTSPPATSFGPQGVNNRLGPTGGFSSVHNQISNWIQHYNVFYFDIDTRCFSDYETMFDYSAVCAASIKEISFYANLPINRIIITKPILSRQAKSGYVSASDLRSFLSIAKHNLSWDGGLIGWSWDDTNKSSSNWFSSIYSEVTPSPPPSPIICEPRNSWNSQTNQCECSGDSCSSSSTMIIVIVVPIIVAFIVAAAIIIFLIKRKKILKDKTIERVSSGSISIDLESNYSTTNLVTEYNSIVIKQRLGRGGSGIVHLGVWRHIDVAVKEFNNQDILTTDFIRESEIHAKLRHPNVVQLLAICLPPHMCTISEFMEMGSLADVIQQKNSRFTWKRKIQALHDIAKGMDYLHKSKIIHRDLKSQNCLVDKNWTCKIADFGTSKLVNDLVTTATSYVPRTAQWSAPEVIAKGEYSEKSDVFSYGVIMWEVLTGRLPYEGIFAYQVEEGTVKGSRLSVPVGCEEWFSQLMTICWDGDAAVRPDYESVISVIEAEMKKF